MRALTRSVTSATLTLLLGLAACTRDGPTVAAPADATAVARNFPDVLSLPSGFSPEGIAFGSGSTFYVGSLATGAIYRGDARTGSGGLFISAQAGRSACGLKYDARKERLFVAGSFTGQAHVYDAKTGATLAVYQLSDPTAGPTSINDAVIQFRSRATSTSFRTASTATGL